MKDKKVCFLCFGMKQMRKNCTNPYIHRPVHTKFEPNTRAPYRTRAPEVFHFFFKPRTLSFLHYTDLTETRCLGWADRWLA